MEDNFNWKKLQNGSDIRGVALEGIADEKVNLTPEVIKRIGKGFVTFLTEKLEKNIKDLTISIGRDSRLSGEILMNAIMDAMIDMEVNVYDFNLASTPAMFMSTVTENFNCDGAIMLTASHLPFNRNGLKFFTSNGGLDKPDIKAILKIC